MRDVKICFCSGTKINERIIQLITGSKWNHVYLQFWSEDWSNLVIIDITARGVLQLPILERYGEIEKYELLRGKDRVVQAIIRKEYMLGREYDWCGLIMGLVRLFIWKITGKRIMRSIHSKGRLFCSEYVYTILKEAFQLEGNPSEQSPKDIYNWIRSSTYFKRWNL